MADYVSPEDQKFKRYYKLFTWWINNKMTLRKVVIAIIIAIEALLVIFAIWTMLDSFVLSYPEERAAVEQMVVLGQDDLHAYTQSQKAMNVDLEVPTVISAGSGTYELVAFITNTNDDWYATFEYGFEYAGREGVIFEQGFILPNTARKPLVEFNHKSSTTPRNVELKINNFVWHRIDNHQTGDLESWLKERLQFKYDEVVYDPNFLIDTIRVGNISFTITNQSQFSYYDPVFYVVIERGSKVLGIKQASMSSIDKGETVMINENWFGTPPSSGTIRIEPNLNLFDAGIYKSAGGTPRF